MNPGSPAPQAPSVKWSDFKADFQEYVKSKGYNPETAKHMVRYLDRYVTVIQCPMDVMKLFSGLSVGQAHQLNRALRAFFNFLELMGYDEGWLNGLRKAIPKDHVGVDLRVPEEREIVKSMLGVRRMDLKYQALWHLCLDSGVRFIEAIHLVSGFSHERLHVGDGFNRYKIGEFRGTKQSYFAYFTDFALHLIRKVSGEKVSRPDASHYFWKYGVTPPKYLRKFAFDKMIELEIPESVADFIEGRVPQRIGAKHYMALARQADKYYSKYTKYLAELRQKAGLLKA